MPSMSQGIAVSVIPSDCSALLTSPTLSLNRNLNWKPTRIGENIIGNIISVRKSRCPRVTLSTSSARPRPNSISRLSATVSRSTVRPNAVKNTGSENAFT